MAIVVRMREPFCIPDSSYNFTMADWLLNAQYKTTISPMTR